jgi:hypothetical protein
MTERNIKSCTNRSFCGRITRRVVPSSDWRVSSPESYKTLQRAGALNTLHKTDSTPTKCQMNRSNPLLFRKSVVELVKDMSTQADLRGQPVTTAPQNAGFVTFTCTFPLDRVL